MGLPVKPKLPQFLPRQSDTLRWRRRGRKITDTVRGCPCRRLSSASQQFTDWRFGSAPSDPVQLLQRRDDPSWVTTDVSLRTLWNSVALALTLVLFGAGLPIAFIVKAMKAEPGLESAQGDKWSFWLTAGTLCLRIRSDHDETSPSEPQRSFKAKVALAAIKGDRNDIAQLAEQFDVHPNEITSCVRRSSRAGLPMFLVSGGGNGAEPPAVDVKVLHAKIGELTVEKIFWEQGLRLLPGRSAKR